VRERTQGTEGERKMPLVWRKPHFQCHCIRCQPMHLNQSACQSSCQSAWMSEKQMERLQWLV